MKQGSIPEKLSFFIRQPIKVGWRWEDVEGGGIDHEVFPCYISDASNKNTLKTGEEWGAAKYWNRETGEYVKGECSVLHIDNKPFSNIRIITLEIRDKGGRAYKVCADIGEYKNLYFDMREDVLLDTLFQVGIEKGGVVPGEFIFARVGSQMKPIRVGSFLYEKMVESTNYNKKGKVEELVVGGIYHNKNGEPSVYLGQYWTRDAILEIEKTNRDGYSYYLYDKVKSVKLSEPFQAHVFHNAWFLEYAFKGQNDNMTKKPYDLWYRSEDIKGYKGNVEYRKGEPMADSLQIIKNHSFKECAGVIEVPVDYYKSVVGKIFQRYKKNEKESKAYYMREYAKLFNLSEEKGFVSPAFVE